MQNENISENKKKAKISKIIELWKKFLKKFLKFVDRVSKYMV